MTGLRRATAGRPYKIEPLTYVLHGLNYLNVLNEFTLYPRFSHSV